MNRTIALMLCRGNSKGIKNKNLINFLGKPLIWWTIKDLKSSKLIENIYVSSDSDKILKFAKKEGVKIIKRPKNISKDYSISESALLHALKKIKKNAEIIVFAQVTSPLRPKKVFDNAINFFVKRKYDSMFSSTKDHNFIWKSQHGRLSPNYNFKNRPMRQKINCFFKENGSFYIFKKKGFVKFKNRLFGKIGTYILDKKYSFEIDDKIDLKINKILKNERL
jgi:N-acylneuraminate cytidylyltransferase